jgi:hypothetical protein
VVLGAQITDVKPLDGDEPSGGEASGVEASDEVVADGEVVLY